MFDNLSQNNFPITPNTNPGASQPVSPQGNPGPQNQNVPVRPAVFNPKPNGPELNFNNPNQNGQVDDMFAQTDNPYGAPNFRGPGQMPNRPLPPQVKIKGDFGGGGVSVAIFVIPILIVAVIALVVVAGWLVFKSLNKANLPADNQLQNNSSVNAGNNLNAVDQSNNATQNNQQEVVVPTTTQTNTNIVQTSSTVPAVTTSATSVPTSTNISTSEKDSDGDGLSDAQESRLGTNPLKADTDNDGLTDYAEVTIYKSDPLNPDTDGDGFKDGSEVINGYDPVHGAGAKLPK
ncbi:MAG: hypothetical protein WCV92_04270 [Candidatus Buchananbacteria bacterium]